MRLNARDRAVDGGAPEYREAVLTTPACGAGTCHFGSQTAAERSIDGILFFNESADPTHWTDSECERMLREWCEFAPRGVEADPAYLAIIARAALQRGMRLPSPEFVTLTYETTTRAMRRDIGRAFDAPCSSSTARPRPACCSWSASTAGCTRTSATATSISCRCRARARLARVLVTTLGRAWMPLLRYDIGDVVRVAESRDCACGLQERRPVARARRRPAERLHGRGRRDDHAADARRRDPRSARTGGDDRAVAACRRHPARRRSRVAATARRAAAAAVGALLARPIRGEHVARDRTRGLRQVPARETLMRSDGLSAARARLRRLALHLPRQRVDDAEAARGDRRGRRATTRRSARTCIAACIRSPRRRRKSTSARAIESRR